ncbi:16S rRNA (guanine(527)-N(7))-methyltransferase RsmG [Fulvivirgaceae bacterium BMA12]|uniref:Ribosomal RNA small subunit methyltransferase G n=1 Tax=Agaribacillus aureus TaxID=3051825 RepID=A0ABT8L343_9BACT|nr:16S rRNA (guanine(527)-N(7))-methyltransferase RsmG [Fulvivirgaceae bacterium BMA12]
MDSVTLISRYFPHLTTRQKQQFRELQSIYREWNQKINVISRKGIEHLYLKHCLHSLGIAKVCTFLPGQQVLDVGTGGGFPGIPLAILFPDTHFTLVDSIGKKIKVVNAVVKQLDLQHVNAIHQRAERVDGRFHFIVSRAVTRIKPFFHWVEKKVIPGMDQNGFSHGILYLKGGDLTEEMKEFNRAYQLFPLSQYFEEDFFDTKVVVHIAIA